MESRERCSQGEGVGVEGVGGSTGGGGVVEEVSCGGGAVEGTVRGARLGALSPVA